MFGRPITPNTVLWIFGAVVAVGLILVVADSSAPAHNDGLMMLLIGGAAGQDAGSARLGTPSRGPRLAWLSGSASSISRGADDSTSPG